MHQLGYGRLMERPPDGDMPRHVSLSDRAGHFVDLMPLDLAEFVLRRRSWGPTHRWW